MHSLLRSKTGLVLIVALMVMMLDITVQPTRATWIPENQSTISFTVHIDQARPTAPNSHNSEDGVAQPDIPKNGQEIHYTASGQNTSTGRLPQTDVLKSSFLSLLGSVLMLLAIVWRRQQHVKKEAI